MSGKKEEVEMSSVGSDSGDEGHQVADGEKKEDVTQIDILDTTAVRHLLDDFTAKGIKEYGFKEDVSLSNVKIGTYSVHEIGCRGWW